MKNKYNPDFSHEDIGKRISRLRLRLRKGRPSGNFLTPAAKWAQRTGTRHGILMIILALVCFLTGGCLSTLTASETGPSFQLPPYEKMVLKNGFTVYLMEQHEVPLISISAVFPAGAVKDNGRYGLASLTAKGLLMGTKNYTKEQTEEQLDFLGASYSTGADTETAAVSLSFLNTHQDTVFPILKEIITCPVFDQTEFDKEKKRVLMELEQAREVPSQVIDDYYNKFLYGEQEYGNPVEGIRSSVEKIDTPDLKAFYQAHYLPGESVLAVVGDFETPAMKQRIEQLFNDWQVTGPDENPRETQTKALPVFKKPRVLLVDKKDATETQFAIGGFGIQRSNPDFVAIQVINTILGGRFTSWLNDELRVNAGLTYGARSKFQTYKNSGTFAIRSYTRTSTTTDAIDLALKVMDRLHRQGIDEKTLLSAQNYIKGQFPPKYETSDNLAELLTEMFFYRFDESFINDFQKNVEAITVEKANRIIARYFPKSNLQFVLIGKASDIRDKVKKYGEITEKEITADGF